MALILDLDVLECDVSRNRAFPEGELGRCLVFDPDPVGIKKFLVAMAGIMAEDHFFSNDRGGLKDRKDAFEHLRRFLRHYNRMPRYDSLKPVLEEASKLFHKPETMKIVERAALMMIKQTRIGSADIIFLRDELKSRGDHSSLLRMVKEIVEPEEPVDLKRTIAFLYSKTRDFLLRFRKM